MDDTPTPPHPFDGLGLSATPMNGQVEHQLAASEARFRAVWDSSADAMALSDANGIVFAANPAYYDLYGYTTQEVLGCSFAIIFPEAHREEAIAQYRRYFLEGESRSGIETEVQRSDGTSRTVDVRYAFIEDGGQRTAMLSVIRDVTERTRLRQMERELARHKDDFVLAVSHDLKNPVASIRGYAQLLRRRLAKAGDGNWSHIREGLDRIEEAAIRMQRMIEDLVDTAIMDTGHEITLQRAPVDLVATVRDAVSRQGEQAGAGHHIVVETAYQSIVGVWDGVRMYRVIDNLLSNAIKYSPQGGHIVVRLDREGDEATGCAVLRVTDDGIGIAETDVQHIFERFYRAAKVREGVAGSGIGLVGVRHIVERHGGSIAVQSVEGQGTTFTARLPLRSTPQ